MQNLTLIPATSQEITPEIAEALKTARHAEFRLEAEYFHMDWESRLELAEELYALCDELPDELADITGRVASDLESELEDFSTWDTRTDAAEHMRQIIRVLTGETLPAVEPDTEEEDDSDDLAERTALWFAGYDTLDTEEQDVYLSDAPAALTHYVNEEVAF
jgi:hypothetical protein